jgi:hypothetical protein
MLLSTRDIHSLGYQNTRVLMNAFELLLLDQDELPHDTRIFSKLNAKATKPARGALSPAKKLAWSSFLGLLNDSPQQCESFLILFVWSHFRRSRFWTFGKSGFSSVLLEKVDQ